MSLPSQVPRSCLQRLAGYTSRSYAWSVPRSASKALPRLLHDSHSPLRSSVSSQEQLGLDYSFPAQEFAFLQNLVKKSPLFFQASKRKAEEFQFPLGTTFKAPSREIGLEMKDAFAQALREYGIIAVELGFSDPKSQFMLEVVEAMGCSPDTHSSTQGALWDVTYRPEGVISKKTGGNVVSISHSLGEFAWHTDGCFEVKPQRYFGLHILHPDKLGGGIFRVLAVDDLIKLLSPASIETLLNYEFELQVPPEFYKGAATTRHKLLSIEPNTGRYHMRFRRDILADPPSDDPAANAAVAELNAILDKQDTVGQSFSEDVFKENVILLMDNARFLHCRTQIKDPRRFLRRIRFNGTPGARN
ncbi:hypothetical protein LV164_001534 [Aspergillus fumigatus]|nr:hypothetical protein KXX42_002521 [Aspergillus fumigatus]KAH2305845.1 hypothetical protein KXV47_008201 [Aspergillus fumigatus]KAH3145614.1 hypothetical protein KXW18_007525 [Aspergillus fumigatus]KAH3189960.1 hypothetical protein KXV92_003853 [Aspergillus fumigatus]KAJ8215074.1 hypothetical protein LV164_001534 [Aspergillus fumigatus]